MEQFKTTYNRRSFLKSSFLAGGGLMISFSWLPEVRTLHTRINASSGRME